MQKKNLRSDASKVEKRSFGTHDGTFHADEVTAGALLLVFNLIDNDKIYRTRCYEELSRCEFVCDVGGAYDSSLKLFDHHQAEYSGFLSSAGMILKYLRDESYIELAEYNHLNHFLVIGVDAHDNGKDLIPKGHCSFSHIISNFTPINYCCTKAEQTAAFMKALQFTCEHINRLLDRFRYVKSCREYVAAAMNNIYADRCLLFDRNMPWLDAFFELGGAESPAQFIIMPSGNHWKLRAIPPSMDQKMNVRNPLPKNWAGLIEDDLKKVSNIPGAVFCHKGRFISVWETKEAALQALHYTLSLKLEEGFHDDNF